jgi:hypothetical protein
VDLALINAGAKTASRPVPSRNRYRESELPPPARRVARRTLLQMSSPCRSRRAQNSPRQTPEWNRTPSPTMIRSPSRRGAPRALPTRRTPSARPFWRATHRILRHSTFPLTSANTYYVPTECGCERWGVKQCTRCPRGPGSCSLRWGLYIHSSGGCTTSGWPPTRSDAAALEFVSVRQWRCARRFVRSPFSRLLCRYAWLLQLSAK